MNCEAPVFVYADCVLCAERLCGPGPRLDCKHLDMKPIGVYLFLCVSAHRLLSSSADGTSRCWSVSRRHSRRASFAACTLPHSPPCFVYTGRFHPQGHELAVTGAYDKRLRLWSYTLEDRPAVRLCVVVACLWARPLLYE